ncbi:neuropilin and tolloid-like protein 2 [Patiria miniata]|uniref:CUB domain-containing protein n=1 Tax=Patiria miniata TaxID=46514 RepID=A0A914ASB9_PATMI|nr:neuropilin and tolloid-like protein 2 [Patiria miniata]
MLDHAECVEDPTHFVHSQEHRKTMAGFNYCTRNLAWWFLLLMLGLLVKSSASEQYMAELCGRTIHAESSGGVLHSQRGPHYRNNVDCTVTITADPGRKILLTFLFLETEGIAPNCRSDYLQIWDHRDGDDQPAPDLVSLCDRFTGNVASKTNAVSLRFETDGSVTYRGFKLAYTSFKKAENGSCDLGEFLCDNSRCIDSSLKDDNFNHCGDYSDERHTFKAMDQLCGQTITAGKNAGLLHSQAAERYSNNLDCTVAIQADYDRTLLLRFEYLDIEGDGDGSGCLHRDVLMVYDGVSAGTVNRTLLCGSRAADIATSGRVATLRFKTDSSVAYRGFVVLYTSMRTPGASDCYWTEFRCTNNRCINANLTFNSFDNCGDNSDEQHFFTVGGGDDSIITTHSDTVFIVAAWVIVVIVIGCIVGLVLIVLCCAFICYLACRSSNRPAQQQASYTAVPAPPQQVGAPSTDYNQQPPMAMQTTGPPANPQPDGQAATYPQLHLEPSEQAPPPYEIKS